LLSGKNKERAKKNGGTRTKCARITCQGEEKDELIKAGGGVHTFSQLLFFEKDKEYHLTNVKLSFFRANIVGTLSIRVC